VGGALTQYVSWRAIFFLNVPVAVGAVVVSLFAARESRDETAGRGVDLPGTAALSLGLTALVLALVEGNPWGWGSPRIVALLAAAAVGLVVFVVIEPRVRAPIVDFAFFRSRTYLGANAVAFVVSFAMLAVFFFIALYLQNILGYSPIEAGVRFLPTTILVMFIAPIAGRLADRIGSRKLMGSGLLVVALALVLLTRIHVGTGYGELLPGLVLMGVGLPLTMSPMTRAAMNAVSADKAGVASGILSMNRMVGATFGVAALGALFQHIASDRLAHTLAGTGLTGAQRDEIVRGLGSARDGAGAGVDPALAARVGHAARDAFVHALSSGMWLCAGVALTGALAALLLVERDATRQPGHRTGHLGRLAVGRRFFG
jgi:EmrB/QacA subfamily drug resistance transporter